jgi:hypothetical protein
MRRFPELISQNLNSEKAVFPRDFRSRWNIVLTGFLMEHQSAIESWIPHVQRWEAEFPSFSFFEIPVLPPFDFSSRVSVHLSLKWYLEDGLRRSRMYPVFTDVGAFLRATNSPNQAQNRIFLLDSRGNIMVNAPGPARENLVELFERKFTQADEDIWRPLR